MLGISGSSGADLSFDIGPIVACMELDEVTSGMDDISVTSIEGAKL